MPDPASGSLRMSSGRADNAEEMQRVWKSVGASGSANNWAFGYYRQGAALGEIALEMVRRETEHCDSLSGFLFFQSLSGGTGSSSCESAQCRSSGALIPAPPCSFLLTARHCNRRIRRRLADF